MTESGRGTTWDFPEGSVGHSDSVKGYGVEATDGPVGTVSWADYKPGESYFVLSYRDGHRDTHHVVPAGAVAEVDWAMVQQFDRGMLGGGSVWPYTDV